MPYTVRVRASLARYLLAHADVDLKRRIVILREHPFPPGSRSLDSDGDLHTLDTKFPGGRAFVYGSHERALVYAYDSTSQTLNIEFGIVDGQIVGRAQ